MNERKKETETVKRIHRSASIQIEKNDWMEEKNNSWSRAHNQKLNSIPNTWKLMKNRMFYGGEKEEEKSKVAATIFLDIVTCHGGGAAADDYLLAAVQHTQRLS